MQSYVALALWCNARIKTEDDLGGNQDHVQQNSTTYHSVSNDIFQFFHKVKWVNNDNVTQPVLLYLKQN